jgi:hypothetical protein
MAIALSLSLGGCSEWSASSHYAMAVDAASFIRAAQADDRASFDAYIDWPSVRSDLQGQLAQTGAVGGAVLPAAAESGGGGVERMVRPRNFHFKASLGSFGGMLGAAHLALMVRPAGDGRLCLPQGFLETSCVLTFAREGQGWKVVGMSLDLLRGDDSPSWPI